MKRDTHVADEKAHQILQRAAEIDRRALDSVSVETLRAAAREAGITESAFETALLEQSHAVLEGSARESRRRALIHALAASGAGGLLLLGLAMLSRLVP